MIEKIITAENLVLHGQAAAERHIAPGYDGMNADSTLSWLQINAEHLCRQIIGSAYAPMPAIAFQKAKRSGGQRRLVKLTVTDIVIQQTILDELVPIFETVFSDHSFAYRPGRGVETALERYIFYANRHKYAIKMDLCQCFDNIDHALLEQFLEKFFEDRKLLKLIMQYVKMPLEENGKIIPRTVGLLQGMPLSPLLCNIYFHVVDTYLETLDVDFVRYGDDIMLFADRPDQAQELQNELEAYLQQECRLVCRREKCTISAPAKMHYLGHRFEADKRGLIALNRNASIQNAYRAWHAGKIDNNHRRIDIVQDGILRQQDMNLLFDGEIQDASIPPMTTESINIYSNVIFDSNVLLRTMKHGIVINIFDAKANKIGSFIPNRPMRSPNLPHKQLMTYYEADKRLALAKEFVLASLHNCRLNIRYHNKQAPNAAYEKAIEALQALQAKIKKAKDHNTLLLAEAQVRRVYYGCYDLFIHGQTFTFSERTRRPPKDEINALLSFGNTVLYNLLATEIEKSPLDIQIGYLHATNARRESLNLDFAEVFKPLLVDRTVFALINKKCLRQEHFYTTEQGGVFLNAEGKRIYLRAFYEKLEQHVSVGEDRMNYLRVIHREIQSFARHFRQGEPYRAFRQVR